MYQFQIELNTLLNTLEFAKKISNRYAFTQSTVYSRSVYSRRVYICIITETYAHNAVFLFIEYIRFVTLRFVSAVYVS
jgi:hypothetical protein